MCVWHNRPRQPFEDIALMYVHLCLVHCRMSVTPTKLQPAPNHAIVLTNKMFAAGAARDTSALRAAPACINIWCQAAAGA